MLLIYVMVFAASAYLVFSGHEVLGSLMFLLGLLWFGCDLYQQDEQ